MPKETALAITGDVGAGKSTVCDIFESLGATRIDADGIVAELWRRPEVVETAVSRWGTDVLDENGRIAHAQVAARIFDTGGSRTEYEWVNAFLHPLVKAEIRSRVDKRLSGEWFAVEIPLLFEAGVASWVTDIVFVTAPRELRIERCRARGWDEREMERRESFFLPSLERMALSDYIVDNDGDREHVKRAVEAVYADLFGF